MRLENRIAVITGSDSGMGQAVAIEFAREGAHVAINCLEDEAGAQATLRQVTEAGRRGIAVQADVRDLAAVEVLFRRAQDELGTPDILVNNAGVGSSGKLLAEVSIPWNRPGEPWEIARLAVHLASDDAGYVTGQTFTIDGGLEMNWGQGA